MNVISTFFNRRKSGGIEIGFSKVEHKNNRIIGKLLSAVNSRKLPSPINLEKKGFRLVSENKIIICHARLIAEKSNKGEFLSDVLNDSNWWKQNFKNSSSEIIYLFCCHGYNAYYWKVQNYLDNLPVRVISYHNKVKIVFNISSIKNHTAEYFSAIRRRGVGLKSISEFESVITEEKQNMRQRLKDEFELVRNKDSASLYELTSLEFQIKIGFQTRYNLGKI